MYLENNVNFHIFVFSPIFRSGHRVEVVNVLGSSSLVLSLIRSPNTSGEVGSCLPV